MSYNEKTLEKIEFIGLLGSFLFGQVAVILMGRILAETISQYGN